MMPKGVEHNYGRDLAVAGMSVRIPMMPKGVEHLNNLASDIKPKA